MEFIRELLLDGNFKDPDVEMEFNFPEIDLDNQIKKETHIVSLWQNNLITRTEARNMMDYEVNLDDQDTFLHLVDIPKIQAQADAQAMVAQVKAAATPKPAGVSSSKKNAKKTSNRVAPANQHGKKVRPKYVKNSVENLFDGLSIFNQDQFISDFMNDFEIQLHDALNYNIDRVIKFYHIDKPTIDNTLVDKYIYDLRLCINDKVKRAAKFLDDEVKLNFYSTKTREFLDEQYSKIESLSKILVCKSLGFKTILITSNDCENHSDKNFEISQMDYTKLPPFGYNCKCEISEENFHEFT
jgi:hypothetical protein